MTKTISTIFLLILAACSPNKTDILKPKQFDFILLYNGPDTIYKSGYDTSYYEIWALPIINNLSQDTVVFIKSIYGRGNRSDDFVVSPKFGINIYKDNKKILLSSMRGCGNWGYLKPSDFVSVYPNKLFLPFNGSLSNSNYGYNLVAQIPVTGEVEIEAYYNTLDTCQANYHYFSDKEMKMGNKLVEEEYNSCKHLFKQLPHVDLRSNRIKVYLK